MYDQDKVWDQVNVMYNRKAMFYLMVQLVKRSWFIVLMIELYVMFLVLLFWNVWIGYVVMSSILLIVYLLYIMIYISVLFNWYFNEIEDKSIWIDEYVRERYN